MTVGKQDIVVHHELAVERRPINKERGCCNANNSSEDPIPSSKRLVFAGNELWVDRSARQLLKHYWQLIKRNARSVVARTAGDSEIKVLQPGRVYIQYVRL